MNPWKVSDTLKTLFTPKQITFLLKGLYSNYVIEEEDQEDPFGGTRSPDLLTMPLMLAAGLDPHSFYEIRNQKYCKDILYPDNTKPIFLGAGNFSVRDAAMLHQRLSFALSELSGEQQNGGMGTEYNKQSGKEAEQNIKDVLRDLIHAFGYSAADL